MTLPPGSETELPYLCPMDHVFEVETWLRPMPENEAGELLRTRTRPTLNLLLLLLHTPISVRVLVINDLPASWRA